MFKSLALLIFVAFAFASAQPAEDRVARSPNLVTPLVATPALYTNSWSGYPTSLYNSNPYAYRYSGLSAVPYHTSGLGYRTYSGLYNGYYN